MVIARTRPLTNEWMVVAAAATCGRVGGLNEGVRRRGEEASENSARRTGVGALSNPRCAGRRVSPRLEAAREAAT